MAIPSNIGRFKPMLATRGELPNGDDWIFEIKWDGFRAIAVIENGTVNFYSRNQLNITARYPSLAKLPKALLDVDAVLDGEIVAVDEQGIPRFNLLQNYDRAKAPISYVAFDLLYLNGKSLIRLPWKERRAALDSLKIKGSRWQTSLVEHDGSTLFDVSRQAGYEGIMAKNINSKYKAGARSREWIKIKHSLGQEVVIGGWSEGEGSRANWLGALLVGYYENGELSYAGRVGTGFGNAQLSELSKTLSKIEISDSPFANLAPAKKVHFVDPVLVAEVEFHEWTNAGLMRAPVFKGLRTDKDAKKVKRES